MTDEIERQAERIFREIEGYGGVLGAIERGYFRRRIAESALRESRRFERREKIVVGVNMFREEGPCPIEILQIPQEVE